jgi:hydrogenase expression/formation protein HypE
MMDFKEECIQMHHGDGGHKSSELINKLVLEYLGNEILNQLEDSAVFESGAKKISFTTDSYVISPIFFPGGDIGRLSICGTVNDLSTSGCEPAYISLSLIIEEGFPLADLKKVIISIRDTAREAGVKIVTGDIKVVSKGQADGLYINTSGVGFINHKVVLSGKNICPGDSIIINGSIADHGLAVLSRRPEFGFSTGLKSDCAPLNKMIGKVMDVSDKVHAVRDATRGGLATVLIELSKKSKRTFEIWGQKIPIRKESRGLCEFLGLDPLYIANEGKMVIFVPKEDASKVMGVLKGSRYGKDSSVIGEVKEEHQALVLYQNILGTKRVLDKHYSEQLPRIC